MPAAERCLVLLPLKGGEPRDLRSAYRCIYKLVRAWDYFTFERLCNLGTHHVNDLTARLAKLYEAGLLTDVATLNKTKNEFERLETRYDPGPKPPSHYAPSVAAMPKAWSGHNRRPLPVGASQVHPEEGKVPSFKLPKKLGALQSVSNRQP